MLNYINKKKAEKGFTLIELMIVVAIIGILAAIAIPQFAEYRKKAYNGAAESDLRNMMTAEEAYFADNQAYTSETAVTGPTKLTSLPAVRVSKNVGVVANADNTVSPAEYAAFAGHKEGTLEFGGDSNGLIQKKSNATPETTAKAETRTNLSGWGGINL